MCIDILRLHLKSVANRPDNGYGRECVWAVIWVYKYRAGEERLIVVHIFTFEEGNARIVWHGDESGGQRKGKIIGYLR